MPNKDLISLDNFEISKLSNDECGYILWYNKYIIQPKIKEIEERLKNGTVLKLTSEKYDIVISKPTPKCMQPKTEIDWTAIINYAKKNNIEMPMTYDYEKAKELSWVQELLNDSAFWQVVQVPKKAFNGAITIKEKKDQ